MRSEGVETLKAVARRSAWIVLLLVALGVLATNLVRRAGGPEYEASSRVVLSPTDLASTVAGFQGYVDPDLVDQTEQSIARSPRLFDRAAAGADGAAGSASELRSATTVTKDGGTLIFTVTGDDADRATRGANALAFEYPDWRADVAGRAIDRAIAQVESQLETGDGAADASLRDQLSRLEVLKTLTSGNVLLVENATGASQTRPDFVRDSLVGGFIGLFIALLVVGVREAVDTRVRSEAEVEDLLNVPVVGTVERLPRRVSLVLAGRARERFGDMYGLLAANLMQAAKKERRLVIAVTSATAEEGKTTTASNLAAALAQRGGKVVLVDLDSRKPSLAKMFRIPPTAPGISDVIARRLTPEAAMWTVSMNGRGVTAYPSTVDGGVTVRAGEGTARPPVPGAGSLQVLPMRPGVKDGLGGHARGLQTVLTGLSKRFDYVVVDTPPALSLPDMTEIAELVDIVLIVIRHGRVSRRSLAALTRLQRGWPDVHQAAVLVGTPRYDDSYAYYGRA